MDEGDLKPETTTEDSTPSPPPLEASSSSSSSSLTPEQLAAKGIVPVKKEYLLPPPPQRSSNSNNNNNSDDRNAQVEDKNKNNESSSAVKVKKSKRQAKRERKEEQKSALHICPNVVKSGSADGCRYGSNCRYSHDLEAFEAQKPEDLEGKCPFLSIEGPCPYGLTCRFAGTHRTGIPSDGLNAQQKSSEVNGLKKETQRLLWKNKACFPKADAQLKLLGLLDKVKLKKPEVKEDDSEQMTANVSPVPDEDNGCDVVCDHVNKGESGLLEEVFVDEAVAMDDLQPLKKAKVAAEEEFCCGQNDNRTGASPLEKGFGESCSLAEVERISEIVSLETDASLKLHPREKKLIDFRDKLYLAPLTTVGNLPFRRVCKVLGADVTCGEMAMCTNLLQGQASEWALLRRHSSEDVFGVQICGAYPDTVARTVEIIERECDIDFIDINMGCPIDLVCNKGAGSSLLTKPMRMKNIIHSASATVEKPITVKVRTAYFEGRNRIDSLISDMGHWGASAVTIHGRSRQQRYSKGADWDYIYLCAKKAPVTLQVIGNGDVSSYLDWNKHKSDCPELSACMIARGALIKPWLFIEIKEQRHWDISSSERLDILKDYVRFGLQHWGSDTKGVETTRHFLLEWLSYTYRYVPVGLLDIIPQKLNWRPPSYYGRDELETLMASDSAADWIRISEILLGKVPDGFTFAPKHKSNAYDKAENG